MSVRKRNCLRCIRVFQTSNRSPAHSSKLVIEEEMGKQIIIKLGPGIMLAKPG